ncbi:MAG: response regulator transcription factor [Anaerofustis stercorihominis]|nr:response regulator transcription factor [Anaerofustis stercorihominis]
MANKETILIVDDDEQILRFLKLQLTHNEYDVLSATNGEDALKILQNKKDIPLILLDIMLPGIDGVSLCSNIKSINPKIKIIMVSAKNTSKDVINSLDSGADDYVKKPFVFDELLARIRANLRKTNNQENSNLIIFEDLIVDRNTFEVKRSGEIIDLSRTEYDLLEYMLLNNNIVQSREQILDRVWGYQYMGNDNIVDVYIKYLRDKIDKDHDRKLIQTVRGRGYVIK